MTYYVSSGVTSTGVSLNSDTMFVFSGGTANNTMVNSGGSMFIYSGGTVNNATVKSGGWLGVSSGGTDDIAWSNTDTGLTGYWQIENKELASWQNLAVI